MKPSTAQVLSIHQRPNLRLQGHNVEVVAHAVHAAVLVLAPWCHAAVPWCQKKGLCLGGIAGFMMDLCGFPWKNAGFQWFSGMVFRQKLKVEMLLKGGKHSHLDQSGNLNYILRHWTRNLTSQNDTL